MNSAVTIIPSSEETAEAYHGSGAWGSTLISHFIRSPLLAHLIQTGKHRQKPTAAMRFGSAFHALIDPGGGFDAAYRIGPDVDHRTKAWKDAVATAATDGVTLLATEDQADLVGMRASVAANPVAASLLNGAEHEVGFRMASGFGPFQVQCRADILHRWEAVADLKTCADVDDFAGSVASWGYHRQAALYRWIIFQACGRWLPFSFIVVERQAPLYRCRVIDLSEAYLDQGWREVQAALVAIGNRYRTADWRDHRDADSVDLPLRRPRLVPTAA